jgi:DNA polymerase III epsilon subunit-like protein
MDRSNDYEYQIVSLGAVVTDSKNWAEGNTFYVEIHYNGTSAWSSEAQAVHGMSKDHLSEHGVSEEEALTTFCEFLGNNFDTNKALTLGGHNVDTFDRHFIAQWFNKYDMAIKLSGHSIDSHSVGSVLYNTKDSNELFEMFNVIRDKHNALEDARAALKAVRMIKKVFTKALDSNV